MKKVTDPESSSPGVTVLLPAFNEEVSIGSVVLLTKKYATRVLVIDDGSSDRTTEIAKMAGAEVLVHKLNKNPAPFFPPNYNFSTPSPSESGGVCL